MGKGRRTYPILVRRGAEARLISSEGPMAGLNANARFEVMTTELFPGDTLIFYTDGLESLSSTTGQVPSAKGLVASEWFHRLTTRSIRQSLIELDAIIASSRPSAKTVDDTTVLALERRIGRGCTAVSECGVDAASFHVTVSV